MPRSWWPLKRQRLDAPKKSTSPGKDKALQSKQELAPEPPLPKRPTVSFHGDIGHINFHWMSTKKAPGTNRTECVARRFDRPETAYYTKTRRLLE